MIIGAHSIIYSKDPDADRAFLRDILRLTNVDVGDGWLVFGLPPAEVAVHPSERNDVHEFYLMCDDIHGMVAALKASGIDCGPVHSLGWGVLTHIMLPGGGKLGVYQPRHARPKAMTDHKARKRNTNRRAAKTSKASKSAKARHSAKATSSSKKAAKALSKRAPAQSPKKLRTR